MSVWQAETHSIEPIPVTERHGKARDLFTLWFSSNMQVTTVAIGALDVIIGLPLVWSIIAIALGNLIGAVFMAYHSAQGPIIGVPQMIQSRAQFGFFGAILPLVLVVVMYLGFFGLSGVLGGQALQGLLGLPVTAGIIIMGVITAFMAIFGYDLIHAYQRYVALIFLVAFLIFSIAVAAGGHVPAAAWSMKGFTWANFILAVTFSVTWQITYAPYVSDYSRYLPKDIGVGPTFNTTYWGTVIASVWMMVLGAVLVEVNSKLSATSAIQGLSGSLGWLMMIIILLGIMAANVLNNYGGMLTLDTIFGTFSQGHSASSGRRIGLIVAFAIVGIVVGIVFSGNFNGDLGLFMAFLSYLVVPWTAINLTDFYLVRHGHYDPEAFFRPAGYGGSNWLAVGTYVLAILIEIPFIDDYPFYEGPISKALGGADISWILGLLVAGGLYLAFSGNRRVAA